jgi:glycosyltransferase involved in cell wall biosynthesis
MRLTDEAPIKFVFVGGGSGKREVDACRASNILSLPYQPASTLRDSLSAADIHVVSIGDAVVGMVHPCKVYGAMAVGRPILLFGPAENHVADILRLGGIGWHVTHGDVDGAVALVKSIRSMVPQELEEMGRRAQAVVTDRFSRSALTRATCDVLANGKSDTLGLWSRPRRSDEPRARVAEDLD